jgi:hypothetical protein
VDSRRAQPPAAAKGNRQLPTTGPDAELYAMLERDVLDNSPGVKWDDIAGLKEAKALLKEAVQLPLLMPHFFQGMPNVSFWFQFWFHFGFVLVSIWFHFCFIFVSFSFVFVSFCFIFVSFLFHLFFICFSFVLHLFFISFLFVSFCFIYHLPLVYR